ncbi:hypothetical protein [Fontivita pretiosa]|uniref:hypothetical protein n=1 Tax=Fontivita pretiosa TaxID=2989684 RepID=UPI003D1765F0
MRSNAKTRGIVLVVVAVVVAGWLSIFSGPLRGEQADDTATALRKLSERVDVLERTVLSDPTRPDRTVLARLEKVELALAKFGIDEPGRYVGRRTFEDIRTAAEQALQKAQELDRRLKAIEAERRGGGSDDALLRELRDLRREMERLARTVEDLKQQVHRLETRR